ncbi:MAG TPA: TFIIB-type zinc ribbon-containing protein [Anaerolineae bacterium]|nr:TFIIB-type zinc ribbon-containing protein [Anaerolineae bacterium]
MTNFPPEGFIPTKSAVPGIDIYMPKPPDKKHEEVVAFTCPNCGGETAYSADNGGLTCTYCGYYEPPKQKVVGKQADEFEFTAETMERVAHGWGVERKELVCNVCAARTTISTDELTHTCPFCGSNQVIQVKVPQDVLRPRFLIPFKTTTDQCRQISAEWLESSWMIPRGLRHLARKAEYTPIYIPFWTFDAVTDAAWRAEVAHTKTYRSGGKTRTKTVWKWESGRAHLNIDDMLVTGTNKLSQLLLQRLRGYNLHELVPYDATYLAGLKAQAYDVNLEDAWEVARRRMREQTKKACKSQASNRRMRNFSMNLDFEDESWRYILLPLYLTTYQYDGRAWQIMINGQNGVIAGQRPVAWRRVWLVVLAALLPALLLGALAFLLLASGSTEGAGSLTGLVAFAAFVIAIVFNVITFRKAMGMDDI